MSRFSKDSDTLTAIAGALIVWFAAIGARLFITEPTIVSGFDLRMFVPSPGAAFWFLVGVIITAIPKSDDFPGAVKSRVKQYILIVLIGAALYYFIAVGSYLGPKNGLIETAQKYSTGAFTPGNGPWFFGTAAFLIALLSPIILRLFPDLASKGRSRDRIVRGRSLISYDQAQKISEKKIKEEGVGLFFGMVNLPDRVATSHFLVCGTTGAGKTTILRLLMQSVLPQVGTGDTRALVYDAKQDALSMLHGMGIKSKIVTLNPFDERCVSWAIAKDVTAPAVAEQIATILIPDEKGSANRYFFEAARSILSGVMISYITRAPGKWTWSDVLLGCRKAEPLKEILRSCPQTEYLIERYFSNEKTANDVMSTLDTKLRPYQYAAAAWSRAKESISLTDWLNGEFVLVLGNDEEARSPIDALNQVIFRRLSELVISQPESRTRRTWIFLDELKEAGKLDGLTSVLTKGRSKGACVVLGFQDIEGLSVTYGDDRTAREIVGLCANKAILRTDSPQTAEWASSLFGAKEVLEYHVSESAGKSREEFNIVGSKQKTRSETEQLQKRDAVLPSEFLGLKPSGPENGLQGYYLIPEVGAYRANINWDSIERSVMAADTSMQNIIRRPVEHQYLSPWTAEDYKRLGIRSDIPTSSGPRSDATPEGNVLDLIQR